MTGKRRGKALRGHSVDPPGSTEPLSPLRPPPRDARSPSPKNLGEEIHDYQAGANRRLQVTKRGWNRFDAAKKKVFLKWFAATANAAEAARRAGAGYSTVFDHRMADARFAEAWDRALEQSYARLEAKVVETQFDQAAGEPIEFDGSFEPPDLPLVDLAMAMQLLKQHKAEVMRIRADRDQANPRARGRKKQVPTHDRERLASDAEMRRALVKSLRAFGVRVRKEDFRAPSCRGHDEHGNEGGGTPADPSTIPSSRNGPPPPGELGEE